MRLKLKKIAPKALTSDQKNCSRSTYYSCKQTFNTFSYILLLIFTFKNKKKSRKFDLKLWANSWALCLIDYICSIS